MKNRLFIFALSLLLSSPLWAADGDTFTAKTVEGITMTFKVLSEADKTCVAGGKYVNSTYEKAIDPTTKGKVTIPETAKGYTVTQIQSRAFSGCDQVTEFIISNSITRIGDEAFWGCSKITSITLPENVSYLGGLAFKECTSLTSVTFNTKDLGMYEDVRLGHVAIAFFRCSALKKLIFGPNVTRFSGNMAFKDCEALTEVHTSDLKAWCGITWSAGSNPLYYAHDFYLNGNKVTDLVIPGNIEKVKKHAFYGCTGLKSVTIKEGVKDIGGAFAYCTNITTANIAASVTNIAGAFSGCENLTKLNIQDIAAWCGYTFTTASANPLSQTHRLYLLNKEITHLKIPSVVTKLNNYAFCGFDGAEIISIPNSITQLWSKNPVDGPGYAFGKCTNLSDFYSYALKVPDGRGAFVNTNIDFATLHVPASALEDYKNTAPWKDFGKIVAYTKDDPNYDPDMDVDPVTSIIGISTITSDGRSGEGIVYNLAGQRMTDPQKGVNIINGRKVVIK